MSRAIAIHFVHDDLRVIIRPFQCNHNAIDDLWIATYDACASSNAVLRIGHLDPFDIGGFECPYRQ